MTSRTLTGWGRTAPSVATVVQPATAEAARAALEGVGERGAIARGLGRAYGDAAQNAGGTVLECTALDAIGTPDADGTVAVGGGASLEAVGRTALPLGWRLPVVPGTRFVTVGGAIAADVHGKNHHVDGSFVRHLLECTLLLPGGDLRTVTPASDRALFEATAGGMGLTGVVVAARLQLARAETRYASVDTERTRDLDDTMAQLEAADARARYSVAWVDLASGGAARGRGVVSAGDPAPLAALPAAEREDALVAPRPPRVPLVAPPVPPGLVSAGAVRAFNALYYRRAGRARRGVLQPLEDFLGPLDRVAGWNRLYGPQGLLQYQCVVPYGAEPALRAIVEALSSAAAPATLAVLKRFGVASGGPLSFPLAGWTLAVDFPGRAGLALASTLDALDQRVVDAGGRVYLAKDARMRAEMVPLMYPRVDEWREVQARVDPRGVLTSDMDRRLRLTAHSARTAR